MAQSLNIDNSTGLPLTVNLTRSGGGSITFYSDATLATPVTMPDSITASKRYYLGGPAKVSISTLLLGQEIASQSDGSPLVVDLDIGTNIDFSPSMDSLESLIKTLSTIVSAVGKIYIQTSGTEAAAFLKTTGGGGHALTAYQAATSGAGVAANLVSDNPTTSCVYVTGTEDDRGSVKIAHLGKSDGSDSAASALSIDLQTTRGGATGTQSQGIYITSTTDAAAGSAPIKVRQNSRDDFVFKGNGMLGIRMPITTAPTSVVEVRQGNDTDVGLVVRANSGSAQNPFEMRDSASALQVNISASGSFVSRKVSYLSGDAMIGATSAQFGGGSGGVIGMKDASTAPTSNPTGGGVLYSQAGALKWRGSSGTITTIAPA